MFFMKKQVLLIFFLAIVELILGQKISRISGQILHKKTKQIIPDAWVVLFEVQESGLLVEIAQKDCDTMGQYFFELAKNGNYKVVGVAENCFANEVKFSTFNENHFDSQNIYLYPNSECVLNPPYYMSLKTIYFEPKSYLLNDENQNSLDYLTHILKNNPNIIISIEVHADIVETEDSTFILSEMRAKEVANYLYNKGIDKERLSWEVCGDTYFLYEKEREEIYRRLNCRVEFRIVSLNYISPYKPYQYPVPPIPTPNSSNIIYK